MKRYFIQLTALALALCALTACGGQELSLSATDSVSVSQAASEDTAEDSSSAASETASSQAAGSFTSSNTGTGKELTTDLAVEGTLELVETDIFADYDYFGAFTNGWAFVVKGNQVGYLSEAGEYKSLYTASLSELFTVDIDYEYLYDFYEIQGTEESGYTGFFSRRQEIYYLTKTFSCNSEGIVPYYQNGLWGLSDLDGNVVVQPQYHALRLTNNLALCHKSEEGANRVYDVLDAKGDLLTTGTRGWVSSDGMYYMIDTDDGNYSCIYNNQGTLLLKEVDWAMGGNTYFPTSESMTFCDGGIIINRVQYSDYGLSLPEDVKGTEASVLLDTQGNILAINPTYDVTYIEANGTMNFKEGDNYGLLDKDFNVIAAPTMDGITSPDENGFIFALTAQTGKIRQYNAQMQEQTTPCLQTSYLDSILDETSGDYLRTAVVKDADGTVVKELESRATFDSYGCLYYPTFPLTEGDWMYYYPDFSDGEQPHVYQVKLAQ